MHAGGRALIEDGEAFRTPAVILLSAQYFCWSSAAMYAPYGPFFAIVPELLPKNVAGGAMALINSMGALGSFVASYAVGYPNGATGSPAASYAFMSAARTAAVVLTLAVRSPSGDAPASVTALQGKHHP